MMKLLIRLKAKSNEKTRKLFIYLKQNVGQDAEDGNKKRSPFCLKVKEKSPKKWKEIDVFCVDL